MSDLKISVCICSHHPRPDYMGRVLAALKHQTLASQQWELVLVDNANQPPLRQTLDLAGFMNVAIHEEPRLGLTFARMCAIEKARGEILVFVDDDNVLDPDYLEKALALMEQMPYIGIAGSRCRGQFEKQPPKWMKRYLNYMAVADHGPHPIWGMWAYSYQMWFPYGAGMVIRRSLAQLYAQQIQNDPLRNQLGRKGDSLSGSEDVDMVFTAMDAGYSVGYFPRLNLKHLIPAQRVTMAYVRRLVYEAHISSFTLLVRRGIQKRPKPWPLSYLTCVLMCLIQNHWHPLTWWVSFQVARAKYTAYRQMRQGQNQASGQPWVKTSAPLKEAKSTPK